MFDQLFHHFRQHRLTLATAESCTGGLAAARITELSGSSDIYIGSIIAYADSVKISHLGVKPELIRQFGAVSEQVAIAMADGVREKFQVDWSISTTGVAGPTGGTDRKPVGTVWVAVSSASKSSAKLLRLSGDRAYIRNESIEQAFALLWEQVK